MRYFFLAFALSCSLLAGSPQWDQAHQLYQRTEYQQSISVLSSVSQKDGAEFALLGQDYFMLADYKKATDALEKAVAMEPRNAGYYNWLGRAWGRRAETASPFHAPMLATKARQCFERAAELDPTDKDALGDLLDYYLAAPGFLGGGVRKAEDLANRIEQQDAAEGHYFHARIAEERKQYDTAEEQLRRAAALAPKQVGRVVALARILAKRGRYSESDAMFEQAMKMSPNTPSILFDRANTDIEGSRRWMKPASCSERYIQSPLTPNDPPRERAEALLKKIG